MIKEMSMRRYLTSRIKNGKFVVNAGMTILLFGQIQQLAQKSLQSAVGGLQTSSVERVGGFSFFYKYNATP